MYLFEGLRLPTDSRALELLGRIHTLWDENRWFETTPTKKFVVYHWQEISADVLNGVIELSLYRPQLLEEFLGGEPTISQLVEWVLELEKEPVDV